MLKKRLLGAFFGASLLVSVPSLAQTDAERAGARAAASEGERAFDEGRYSDAIDLFSRAEKLVHAPPHLLFIARAHLKLGQLVRAREYLIKITLEELDPGAPQAFRDAYAAAQTELSALEPRVPYVTVTVQGGGAKDPHVMMDGARVPDALVGVPQPVDPGKHVFQAFADGMESSETSVQVKEGARETLMLTLQAAPGGGTAAAPSSSSQSAGGGDVDEPAPADVGGGGISPLRIASYVSFGVGGVGLVGGILFAVRQANKDSEADSLFDSCADRGCTSTEQAEIGRVDDEATSAGTLAVVGFVVGGAGVVAGTTLLILDITGDDSAALEYRTADVTLRPSFGYRSVGLSGTF